MCSRMKALTTTVVLFALSIINGQNLYGQGNTVVFSDGFESRPSVWFPDNGVWEVGVPTSGPNRAYAGQFCFGTILAGNYPPNANTRLISPEIALPRLLPGEELQLRFWHWFNVYNADPGVVQISVNGSNWRNLSIPFIEYSSVWTQYIADLSAYADSTIRIAFYFTSNSDGLVATGWYVDDVRIGRSPIITHTPIAVQNLSTEIPITAVISDDTSLVRVALNYRKAGVTSFTSISMAKSTNSHNAIIPASEVTSRGVEYIIEAVDFDTLTSKTKVISTQVAIAGEGLAKTDPQPAGSEQVAYRIISVPLDLDNKNGRAVLEDDLGSYDIFKWRCYEARADQTKREFPNISDMAPGKAVWLIVKDEDKVIDTGAGKTNPTSQPFAIALHPRWNLVGNPFNFSIPLSKLRLKSNGQTSELRTFTGIWNNPVASPVNTMEPFEGYAVFNSLTTVDTLFVNPDLSALSAAVAEAVTVTEEQLTGRFNEQSSNNKNSAATGQLFTWVIAIHAQCQQARDLDNIAAVSANASNTHDEMDRPEPPVIGEYVSVYFPHAEWKTLSENYCTDIRMRISDGGFWTFEVKTNIRDVVQLHFENIETVPPEFEVWLVDEVLKISHNLREKSQYSIAGTEHPKRLKLMVGKQGFIDKQLVTLQAVPSSYELSQNFPNPFSANGIFDNPVTTIRYGLPREERVTLKVYNLFGQEVATLINNELKNTGYHAAIWDGRNNSGQVAVSGVYFIRIHMGSFVQTGKMILIE